MTGDAAAGAAPLIPLGDQSAAACDGDFCAIPGADVSTFASGPQPISEG